MVLVIGLLSLLAIPAFQRIRNTARANILANDLRTFAGAFAAYQMEQGYTPDSAPIAILPGQMGQYLRPIDFYERNTVGGYFKWERFESANGVGFTARENLVPVVQITDELLDDGDLDTGRLLRYEASGQPAGGGNGPGGGPGGGQGGGPQLPDQAADRAHERIAEIFSNRIGSDWVPPAPNQIPSGGSGENITAEGEKFLYIVDRY